MAQKLTDNDIDKQAEIYARKLLGGENPEHVALSILEAVEKNTPETVAMRMICEYGGKQALKVAELMVQKVKARTK